MTKPIFVNSLHPFCDEEEEDEDEEDEEEGEREESNR